MRIPPRIATLGGVAALASSLLLGGASASAAATPQAPVTYAFVASVGSVCYANLPAQAHDTQGLIDRGGPFPYKQDGEVFRNDEQLLPSQSQGYYHEYTVITPGSADRGARRIIAGRTDEEYYTSDHYASFNKINFSC
ncbi:ribonuclease domain-containing protein [Streptomyces sp. NBC_01497]|uniref:ribonuclease domain-containing protein n=1 Tax=Streptomyces sp. NBC_01497 TaxID=2903885 RepID=UPI002E31290D|nr:ribonuclease domain-containing protein [Streptomyces sp. NBC_01497]